MLKRACSAEELEDVTAGMPIGRGAAIAPLPKRLWIDSHLPQMTECMWEHVGPKIMALAWYIQLAQNRGQQERKQWVGSSVAAGELSFCGNEDHVGQNSLAEKVPYHCRELLPVESQC